MSKQPRRTEEDSLGKVSIAQNAIWGAQTQRSLTNFNIGNDRLHKRFIHAFAQIKRCAAMVNHDHGLINEKQKQLIVQAADKILSGDVDDAFPLKVWQTGSGTQTNMNVNEVITNLVNQSLDQPLGSKYPIHPNDHVNRSQSSNDTFPTAMHMAFVEHIHAELRPALIRLRNKLGEKKVAFANIIKIGRTHMQDAVPVTLGQVFSGFEEQINISIQQLDQSLPALYQLAIGGTAVGTGLNAPKSFSVDMAKAIAEQTGHAFITADNKFQALSAHNAACTLSGCLKSLAASLYKMANDIRLLGSGPRCGIGELILPQNEPGSSIMPGKINPTQCEALCMVCIQIFACDYAVAFASSQGHFELNVNKPVIAYNLHHAMDLAGASIHSFIDHCLDGLVANEATISQNLKNSLMLVTALTPVIGYDKATDIAKKAHQDGTSLREACLELGYLSAKDFDQAMHPKKMIDPE